MLSHAINNFKQLCWIFDCATFPLQYLADRTFADQTSADYTAGQIHRWASSFVLEGGHKNSMGGGALIFFFGGVANFKKSPIFMLKLHNLGISKKKIWRPNIKKSHRSRIQNPARGSKSPSRGGKGGNAFPGLTLPKNIFFYPSWVSSFFPTPHGLQFKKVGPNWQISQLWKHNLTVSVIGRSMICKSPADWHFIDDQILIRNFKSVFM